MAIPKKPQETEQKEQRMDIDQSFSQMIDGYEEAQESVKEDLKKLNENGNMNPGEYLKMQSKMSKLSQVAEAISQFMATIQVMIRGIIGKFRPQ